ncbi:membrane protein [Salix suchowensis]|nr:membrane protein [Salix suchowensis]
MASTRNIVGGETTTGNERGRVLTMRDEERAKEDDSPSAKRAKFERFPDNLATYANEYPAQFILGYCSTYIFMQTFMIPGTIFMSLLAGALFGVVRGIFLVVFNATAGASSCFFLSKREKLLNYMLFLRVTPTLPNLFINLASPIVDIPFHIFFLATLLGLIPASYITVRAGLALGDLNSVKDLYDFKTLSVLFLIGSISIFPTLLKRKRIYE